MRARARADSHLTVVGDVDVRTNTSPRHVPAKPTMMRTVLLAMCALVHGHVTTLADFADEVQKIVAAAAERDNIS